jgi:hypothetical protein
MDLFVCLRPPPNLQLPPECMKALQAYKAAIEASKKRRLP